MLYLTDLILTPDRSPSDPADFYLPEATLDLLSRVAPTNLPVLCTDCYGAAFRRVAAAVHRGGGRDELRVVDLRASGGMLPAGLPEGSGARRVTLALDGVEHLGASGQEILAQQLAVSPFRLVSGADADLDTLRTRWRPELLALLSTVTVHAPSLSRRGADVVALAERRLLHLATSLGRAVPQLAPAARAALVAHVWEGDLSELDAVLARTLLCTPGDTVEASDLRWHPDPTHLGNGNGVAAAAPQTHDVRQNGIVHPAHDLDVARAGDEAGTAQAEATASVAIDEREPAAPIAVASLAADESPHEIAPTRDDAAASAIVAQTPPRPSAPLATGPSPTLEALAVELAHQLKNPLVTVKTFVASIESLCDDPHELGQFRALTDEAVMRMDEILEGLLSFARLGAAVPQRTDVLPLLRDALRATWRGFSSKQVTLDAPADAALVASVDLEHLHFALAALARHVAETIEPRGVLAITIENGTTLRFAYHESGAITHLRGAASLEESSLPLALLLVRGALGRVGGDVEVTLDGTAVTIWLRLSPP